MGVTIRKGDELLGVPLVNVRNALRAWCIGQNRNAWMVAARTGLEPWTAAGLLEECVERGLIERTEIREGRPLYGDLTDAGRSLAVARAMKRTPKAQAQAVLDRYLATCARLNAREDLPFRIGQVWIFGSMLDPDKVDVGDIDIVTTFSHAANYPDMKSRQDRYWQLVEEFGIESRVRLGVPNEVVRNHLLNDGRRHQLLAPNDMHTLKDLGCSCRMVFDGGRGGIVDDPILPRHPESQGRDEEALLPRASMPDLAPSPACLTPVSADLALPSNSPDRTSRKDFGPYGARIGPLRMLTWAPTRMATVVTETFVPVNCRGELCLQGLDLRGCDGRNKVALVLPASFGGPGCGIVLERRLRREEAKTTYAVLISQCSVGGASPRPGSPDEIAWSIHALMQADLDRVFRRDLEAGVVTELSIEMSDATGAPVAAEIVEMVGAFEDAMVREVADRVGLEPGYAMPRWVDEEDDRPDEAASPFAIPPPKP